MRHEDEFLTVDVYYYNTELQLGVCKFELKCVYLFPIYKYYIKYANQGVFVNHNAPPPAARKSKKLFLASRT